jgi:chemotaxis protein methyltransferase CheR
VTTSAHIFLAEACAARAGLSVDPDKAYLIENRLSPVARREGYASVAEVLARLPSDDALAMACVEAMASPDTRFFRDGDVLETLWRRTVPAIARRRPDGVVRIWSVGCSSGQEIYSLAMLQAEHPAPTGRVELFASDLSERLLERARTGIYTSFEVQRGLSARRLVRHFENRDDRYQLSRALRQQVRWRRANLAEDLGALGLFDIIVCRNVLDGFTEPARARAAAQLAQMTAPGGLLLLGGAEQIEQAGFAPTPEVAGGFARAA